MSDQQAWDDRYLDSDRIWSGKPNVALVAEVSDLPPGRALDLACGEGADAVWLAARGWQVTAADISPVALKRAAAHAAEAGVEVDWQHHDLEKTFPSGEFDLISCQFLHFWKEFDREAILRRAAGSVAPGGILLIEGHMDHGPFAHGHDVHFPTPDEVVAALRLGDDWDVLKAEVHPRQQTGPDGDQHTRTDSTVKLRRSR
jgi:SAM-dependent methyltransferase